MKTWTKEERYRVLHDPEEIRDMHDRIAQSAWRQTFHIQPVTGLLNDPNGFIRHGDLWHLFYQWCPWGAVHGLKYWYHVISRDLVNWKNAGVCIRPDTVYDNKGAYSGSAYPTDGKIYLYYTGNHRDADWTRRSYTCLVKLNDDGTAEKYTPPLFGPHPDYTEHQRDPKILFFREPHLYRILLGAQNKKGQGRIICYRSPHHNRGWEFEGEVRVPGFENFGGMWECPSIERIGDKDVLIFCPQHIKLAGRGESTNHNGYIIGRMDWNTLTFHPDGSFHVLDFGFDSYAAECAATIGDPDRAILVAWMGLPDSSYPVTDEEEWSGCLTLPRELTIRDRRLIQKPLDSLQSLREAEFDPHIRSVGIADQGRSDAELRGMNAQAIDGKQPVDDAYEAASKTSGPIITPLTVRKCEEAAAEDDAAGKHDQTGKNTASPAESAAFHSALLGDLPKACEMEISFSEGDYLRMLKLFTKGDGSGGITIRADDWADEISVDCSGLTNRFNTEQGEVRTRPISRPVFHLRIFIDSSSVEIFVNDGDAVFTSRVFPTEEERHFVLDGAADIRIWTLRPAVKDDFVV